MKLASQSLWLDLDDGPIDTACARWHTILKRYHDELGLIERFWMNGIRKINGRRQIEVMFESKAVSRDVILARQFLGL